MIQGSDVEFFKYLLKKVDNPSTEMIGSCLLAAIKNQDTSFALELLGKFTFNLNRTYAAQGNFGPSKFFPLAAACQFANPDLIQAMLEKGATPLVQSSASFKNILKWAEKLKKEQIRTLNIAIVQKNPNKKKEIFGFFELAEHESVESLQQKVNDFEKIIELLKQHMPQKAKAISNDF